MRAVAALAYSPAEGVAVRAALLAEVARPTGRALIDSLRAGGAARGWQLLLRAGVAMAPSGLTAGVRAVAAPPCRAEGSAADGADSPVCRYAIVTQREPALGRRPLGCSAYRYASVTQRGGVVGRGGAGPASPVSHGSPSCCSRGLCPQTPEVYKAWGEALVVQEGAKGGRGGVMTSPDGQPSQPRPGIPRRVTLPCCPLPFRRTFLRVQHEPLSIQRRAVSPGQRAKLAAAPPPSDRPASAAEAAGGPA